MLMMVLFIARVLTVFDCQAATLNDAAVAVVQKIADLQSVIRRFSIIEEH